jgi:hypothetical protein
MATKDARLSCPFCKVKTWSRDYKAFMYDHDRPDGRRCVRAHLTIERYSTVYDPSDVQPEDLEDC